jgi:hypothetical protein
MPIANGASMLTALITAMATALRRRPVTHAAPHQKHEEDETVD